MFTGIVETVGRVEQAAPGRLEIDSRLRDLRPGDSVAVNGVCLTVTACAGGRFAADVSEETATRTALGSLAPGAPVNLERPVPAGGPLGGHIVQGHVDATGTVRRIERLRGSAVMWVSVGGELRRYLARKGSVAVDGVSLTVAGLQAGEFAVALIPRTLEHTTLGGLVAGDAVNVEVDIIAKYVERMLGGGPDAAAPTGAEGGIP